MFCRIQDLRAKQVVCVKNGGVLGYVSDVDIDTSSGAIKNLIIFGKLRLLGLLGREDDIIIPWEEIKVIGNETILISCDPDLFFRSVKRKPFSF